MTALSISQIPAGSPGWVHAAVVSFLILHIGAGSIAMLSGVAALSVRKGERLHRVFGTVFFVCMLTMAVMATSLAIWIHQWGNATAGAFAFYLVTTGWVTVRRKDHFGGGIAAMGGCTLPLAQKSSGLRATKWRRCLLLSHQMTPTRPIAAECQQLNPSAKTTPLPHCLILESRRTGAP